MADPLNIETLDRSPIVEAPSWVDAPRLLISIALAADVVITVFSVEFVGIASSVG